MFQFSPLAPISLCIQERVTRHDSRRVSPFGHPRINAYVRLPEAFRSLSRPSSPVRAKASTVRPCSLDRIFSHADRSTWIYPAHRFLPSDTFAGARVNSSSTLCLTNFPIPRFSNATRLGECLLRTLDVELGFRPSRRTAYSRLQKGGDPAAGSPTATLLRLRPSHRARLRRLPPACAGWVTDFGRSRLPWRDGRCVQGPGTYSPWCS